MQKKLAITDLNTPNGSRDIPFQSWEFEQDGRCHFVDFQFFASIRFIPLRRPSRDQSILPDLSGDKTSRKIFINSNSVLSRMRGFK